MNKAHSKDGTAIAFDQSSKEQNHMQKITPFLPATPFNVIRSKS